MFTGNLCNENAENANGTYTTTNNKHKKENGKANVTINQTTTTIIDDDIDTVDAGPGITREPTQFITSITSRVTKNDRNKFGSLPNHLDSDDVCEENGKTIFFC